MANDLVPGDQKYLNLDKAAAGGMIRKEISLLKNSEKLMDSIFIL